LVPGGSSHPELVAETGGSMITNDLFGPPTGE
jgi:hypothetical protein